MAVMNLNRVYFCCLYGNSEDDVIIRSIDRDLKYEGEPDSERPSCPCAAPWISATYSSSLLTIQWNAAIMNIVHIER